MLIANEWVFFWGNRKWGLLGVAVAVNISLPEFKSHPG